MGAYVIAMGWREEWEELLDRGSGVPAPAAVVRLYNEAFERYRIRALWSTRHAPDPTLTQVLLVSERLRNEGNVPARHLAVAMEKACRAAL